MAKAIARNETTRHLLAPVYLYFNLFSSLVEKRKAENNKNACSLRDIGWIKTNVRMMQVFQFGLLDQSCPSFIQASAAVQSGEMHVSLLRNVRDTIYRGTNAVYLAVRDIPQIPQRSNPSLNWTSGAFPGRSWDLTRNSQRCLVSNAFFMHKNGVTYFRSFLNNLPPGVWGGTYGRQSIVEFIRQDMNTSVRSIHRRNGNEDQFENSTTILVKRDGRSRNGDNPGFVVFDDPSSPVGRVYRLNQVPIDLASDAVTVSNIAILALPMVMNIVPLAILADVQGWAMLCYVIFTDVFSTLPLLIKGVELINAGRSMTDVVMFRVGNSSLNIMEIFGVECSGEPRFRSLGIIFVVISSMAIIIGICLEVMAMWYVSKWERESATKSAPRMFNVVSYGFVGAMHESETVMEQYTYNMTMEALEEKMVLAQKENAIVHGHEPWHAS